MSDGVLLEVMARNLGFSGSWQAAISSVGTSLAESGRPSSVKAIWREGRYRKILAKCPPLEHRSSDFGSFEVRPYDRTAPRKPRTYVTVRGAIRGGETLPGAAHRRPQQKAGEICRLVWALRRGGYRRRFHCDRTLFFDEPQGILNASLDLRIRSFSH